MPGDGNGETVYSGDMNTEKVIEIDGDYHNRIVIRDGEVWFEESDCPGKDCMHFGKLSRAGSIACAPNRVSVTVYAESEVDAVVG